MQESPLPSGAPTLPPDAFSLGFLFMWLFLVPFTHAGSRQAALFSFLPLVFFFFSRPPF